MVTVDWVFFFIYLAALSISIAALSISLAALGLNTRDDLNTVSPGWL